MLDYQLSYSGKLAFIGLSGVDNSEVCGVELEEPVGDCNGTEKVMGFLGRLNSACTYMSRNPRRVLKGGLRLFCMIDNKPITTHIYLTSKLSRGLPILSVHPIAV